MGLAYWIIVFLMSGTATPDPGSAISFDELLSIVRNENLVIQMAELDSQIAGQEARWTRFAHNPALTVSSGRARGVDGDGQQPVWSAEAALEILNPFYLSSRMRAARSAAWEADLEARMRQLRVERNAAIHFYRLQQLTRLDRLLLEESEILQEVDRITRAKVRIGEAKKIDQMRSAVALQKIQAERFNIRRQTVQQRGKIKELTNFQLPDSFTLIPDFSFQEVEDIESSLSRRTNNSPLLSLSRLRIRTLHRTLGAERWARLPSFELFAEKEREPEADIWRMGVGIRIPLLNWNQGTIKKARLQLQKARIAHRHMTAHLMVEVRRRVSEIRIQEEQIKMYQGPVMSEGRENLRLAQELYKAGEIPLMQLLDARSSFFNIVREYIQALTDWKILKAELVTILGDNQ